MMRQITFTEFEVGIKSFEPVDGTDTYRLVKRPVTKFEGTSCTKTDARRAIIEAGVDCPRGADVYWDAVAKVRYKFTTEDLLSIAKEREVVEL